MKHRRLTLFRYRYTQVSIGTSRHFDLGVFFSPSDGIFGIALGFAYFEVCW